MKMEDGVREEGKSHESSNQEKVMAEVEAMLISEVEKLESLLVHKANIDIYTKKDAKRLIDEVKMIVEKLRDMRLEEKSKLKYLISDVVEDVGEAHCLIEVGKSFHTRVILNDLKTINEGFHKLLQNDGVGEGDRDGDGDVVGLEEDVELLLHNMKFITSIVGYDGFGKTTLARQLYNHADVVKKFKLRVWVNCLDILGRKELLINLIQQLAMASSQPKDLEKMELEGLQSMLRQQLIGNPCFIVLDNIWRKRCLEFLTQSLPDDDNERNLLLTYSRNRNFRIEFSDCYTFEIRALDEGESWKLVMKTMFPGGNNTCADKFPKKLERKGKLMLMKHTGGMPLAIKDVGMEWAQKRRLGREWEEVIESRDLELRASLGALDSSFYHYLNPVAKECFFHLGLFKLGTMIKAQKFQQTWCASRGEPLSVQLEDGIIQNVIANGHDNAKRGGLKYYDVVAIFHKLSIKKAKEENYGASHRVIYCSREGADCPRDRDERLISLFFNGGGCFDDIPSYLKCFEKLRVLDFEGFGLKSIPETVGELIELRYLGLRNNYIQQLPSSLGCLKNLEVLDIALNFMVVVPDIILEMEALLHLYMSDISCRKPLKIYLLKNLKTLTYISVDNWKYEVSSLQMMTSLCKLGIELNESSNVSKLFKPLAAMKNLECLMLRGSRFRSMRSLEKLGGLRQIKKLKLDGRITMLPNAKNFPPSLRCMTLVNSHLDEDPMPVLEKLSTLVYLKLQNTYTGREMVISKGGFPRLLHLRMREFWHLRNIKVGGRAFSRATTTLEITCCPCLQILPEEMLSNVKIVTTNEL